MKNLKPFWVVVHLLYYYFKTWLQLQGKIVIFSERFEKNIILNFVSYKLAVPQSTAMLTAIDLDLRQQPIAIEVEQHRQQQIVVQSVKTDQLLDNVPNLHTGCITQKPKDEPWFLRTMKKSSKMAKHEERKKKNLAQLHFIGSQVFGYTALLLLAATTQLKSRSCDCLKFCRKSVSH